MQSKAIQGEDFSQTLIGRAVRPLHGNAMLGTAGPSHRHGEDFSKEAETTKLQKEKEK
jgi:hypothetical protein